MNLLYREVIFVSRKELDDLITLCHDKYLEVLKQIKIKSINEIELIYQTKIDRLRQLQLNKNSINKKTVSEFLKTFDYCDVDYKSLEIIIINNPSVFINEIEEYNDDDFFTFTLWMDNFPTDCNISKMKESLKLLETKSHRKNKIKRKIKLKVL